MAFGNITAIMLQLGQQELLHRPSSLALESVAEL